MVQNGEETCVCFRHKKGESYTTVVPNAEWGWEESKQTQAERCITRAENCVGNSLIKSEGFKRRLVLPRKIRRQCVRPSKYFLSFLFGYTKTAVSLVSHQESTLDAVEIYVAVWKGV